VKLDALKPMVELSIEVVELFSLLAVQLANDIKCNGVKNEVSRTYTNLTKSSDNGEVGRPTILPRK
jgi:hypothetical protein